MKIQSKALCNLTIYRLIKSTSRKITQKSVRAQTFFSVGWKTMSEDVRSSPPTGEGALYPWMSEGECVVLPPLPHLLASPSFASINTKPQNAHKTMNHAPCVFLFILRVCTHAAFVCVFMEARRRHWNPVAGVKSDYEPLTWVLATEVQVSWNHS